MRKQKRVPGMATVRNRLAHLAAVVGAPVGDGCADDADCGTQRKHLFHECHAWSPSSQKAQRYKPTTQIAPNAINGHDAWPVTHGLTRVIKATPFAMSYRNLDALVRCRSFISVRGE